MQWDVAIRIVAEKQSHIFTPAVRLGVREVSTRRETTHRNPVTHPSTRHGRVSFFGFLMSFFSLLFGRAEGDVEPIEFKREALQQWSVASSAEWIETDGLGGWASSTIAGAHTRSYHGMLVVSDTESPERFVLLSRLDERVLDSDQSYELSSRAYRGETIYPAGYSLINRWYRYPFPTWEYSVGSIQIRKSVAAIHGSRTVVVTYELLGGAERVTLELRPFAAGRGYHNLLSAQSGPPVDCETNEERLILKFRRALPSVTITVPGAHARIENDWYYNFEYAAERARGLGCIEDLYLCGVVTVELAQGKPLAVVISAESESLDNGELLVKKELSRRHSLIKDCGHRDSMIKSLVLASDQFLIKTHTNEKTILAGYHWFGEWGRDAMISLPGLTLATKRYPEALQILRRFSRLVQHGLIPNLIHDDGRAEFNAVDAALWFCVAVYRFAIATRDFAGVAQEFLPTIEDILHHYRRGTLHNIHAKDDGLLSAGSPEIQLTWMDAKIGKWVVTPRHGKAVEINALWFKAHKIAASLHEAVGQSADARRFEAQASAIQSQFEDQFWNPEQQVLFDTIGEHSRDAAMRPNQVFAICPPFPVIVGARAESILNAIERDLLTPYGLRTLSREHAMYQGRYRGDELSRDAAYHQGTVWAWLIGAYVDALFLLRKETGAAEAQALVQGVLLSMRESGIGSISEVFDGDAPHHEGGSIAQAWSVAELLRVVVEHNIRL